MLKGQTAQTGVHLNATYNPGIKLIAKNLDYYYCRY